MENETTTSPLGGLTTLHADDSSFQGIMSTETRNQIISLLAVSVLPLIFICGTLGNVFTIVVLCCDGLRENVNVVLLCLAVSDLCYVICSFIPFVSDIVKYVDVVEGIKVKALTGWLDGMSLLFSRISAMFVCFIAVQRFIFVAFPLRATTILTKFRVRLTCVLIYVAIICIFFPCFLIGDYDYVFSSEYNETIAVYVTTQFYNSNTQVLSDYIFVYLTILFRIIPVFLVLVLSVLILLVLKRSRKWSQAVSHSDDSKRLSSERKITRTLISVCMLFIVTGIPFVVFYMMLGRLPGFNTTGRYRNTIGVTYTVVSILEMVNSSANFILYITTSTSFYKTFRRLFCSRSNRNDNERQENTLATVVQ